MCLKEMNCYAEYRRAGRSESLQFAYSVHASRTLSAGPQDAAIMALTVQARTLLTGPRPQCRHPICAARTLSACSKIEALLKPVPDQTCLERAQACCALFVVYESKLVAVSDVLREARSAVRSQLLSTDLNWHKAVTANLSENGGPDP